MLRYLVIRLLRALLTLIAIVSFAFIVLRASGDPAMLIMSIDAPPAAIAAFRKAWGLDQSLWVQYLRYFANVFNGSLGVSMRDGRPAFDIVCERIPATLLITVPALLITLLIGIPTGIFAALRRNSVADRLTMLVSVLGYSMPSFVLGLVLVLVFAVLLNWLPSGGYGGWQNVILPAVALGTGGAAAIARFSRSAMLEVLGQPYIRAARAKGLLWRAVVTRHALPNAAIPTVTIVGFMIGSLVAGAVVIESVFSWPGIGRLLVVAVATRDLAVVQTIMILVGLAMIGANLTVDLLYGWIDPRLRAPAAGGGGH
jgi:peptide/nickel transport system permease protein